MQSIPLSLLDLLSCSLVAVIILLIISLNTGSGQEDEVEQATLVEVYAFGDRGIPRPDSIVLTWKQRRYLVSNPLKPFNPDGINDLQELAIPNGLAQELNIGSFIFPRTQNYPYGFSNTLRAGRRMEFTFPKEAKGTELSFYYRVSQNFELIYRLTSRSKVSPIRVFKMPGQDAIELKINCGKRVALIGNNSSKRQKIYDQRFTQNK